MRYDLSIRESVRTKVTALAKDMVDWEAKPRIQPKEQTWIKDNVKGFAHTTEVDEFRIGGVDGSGDYPSLTYADCYVHLGSAAGVIYKTDTLRGLVEEEAMDEPLVDHLRGAFNNVDYCKAVHTEIRTANTAPWSDKRSELCNWFTVLRKG